MGWTPDMMQSSPIAADSILQQLEKILASGPFANADRSRALLKFIVQQSLAGQTDRLKEYTLGTEVFGRPASFDPRTDPIVRAEASRLRNRLEQYYASDGRVETLEISLPRGNYGPQFLYRNPAPEAFATVVSPASGRTSRSSSARISWIVLGVAACLISFVVGRRFREKPVSSPQWKVNRVMTGDGFAETPTLSSDGRLIAYSSNSGRDGEADLYIKQMSGGQPIRLTTDGKGNTMPNFSPDASTIVFRSNRDGGGIYEIPAFGGEIRLLAKQGFNPKFSPDGSQVAYWIGDDTIAGAVPGSGEVWIVPTAGGPARRIGANFTNARFPIWAPDGKHVLLIGYTSDKASEKSAIDWWIVSTEGGPAHRAGMYDALVNAGLQSHDSPASPAATFPRVPLPSCWLAGSIIFSASSGDTRSLWETGISPETGQVTGTFKRLTGGAGNEVEASCASGNTIAFTNADGVSDLWLLPYDLDNRKPKGNLKRMNPGPTAREPFLSGDGRFMTHTSAQTGPMNIWLQDLETGKETHLADSPNAQRFPIINAFGTKVVYSVFESGGRSLYLWADNGLPEKICEGCLRATGWSQDEKSLLIFAGSPYQIDSLDIASRQRTLLLKHSSNNMLFGRFSPNGHQISFTERIETTRALILIAPLDGPKPVPESAWIRIAEVGPSDRANWSPDGRTLYYSSPRDGHTCLWGQRIDPTTHRPSGDPFSVQHFHGSNSYQQDGWSANSDHIVIGLNGSMRTVWTMSRSVAR